MKTYLKEFKVINWSDIKANHTFEGFIKDSPEWKGLFHISQFHFYIPYDSDIKRDFKKMLTILEECGADFVDFDN
jgi:hypothetical protein